MKKDQQTTTRAQLVKMLRNMTDYSNMYNTISNCLQDEGEGEGGRSSLPYRPNYTK